MQSQDDEELALDAKSSMKKSISNFSAEDKIDGEDLKGEQSSFKLESIDMNGLLSMRSMEE